MKTTNPARRTTRKIRISSLFAIAFTVLATLGTLAPASQAGATAWNPNVTLKGRAIACSSSATWVWVEASNGERGWATQPGGNYNFNFKRVPTSGMTVTVKFGNSVCSRSATFGLNRPTVGTTATRNVVTIY